MESACQSHDPELLESTREQAGGQHDFDAAGVVVGQEAAHGTQGARRNYVQKLRQIGSALELERSWTKAQILEAYLNSITFRGELQGIGAASQGLFGKSPHGLDLVESLILAALIRSPGASPMLVQARACALGKVLQPGWDCAALETRLARTPLLAQGIRPREALAPHVAARLLPQGLSHSTLDRELQVFAQETLRSQLLSVGAKNAHDGALLVLDNRSGEVLAYVGGVGDLSSARFVDGVRARRQAGSTLKPFLYGVALEKRYLTAASHVEDTPMDIAVEGGVYRPRNYDNEFHGDEVTVRMALASSLNVPAVRTLNLIGVGALVDRLKMLGFSELREPAFYGPSLALGAADVSLWDLVNAYRALANGGRWSQASLTGAEAARQGSRQVFSPQAAFLVGHILADRESRNLTFGLENPLSSRFWTAVKTGTSKDMRDNWCVGYSQRYTVGVWVGNFSGEPMWNVSGITEAAPAWAEVMNWLHSRDRAWRRGRHMAWCEWRSAASLSGSSRGRSLSLTIPPRTARPPPASLIPSKA